MKLDVTYLLTDVCFGACLLAVNKMEKLKFICPILFFLIQGCAVQGQIVPDSEPEIVVLDPEQSTGQTLAECHVKSKKSVLDNKKNDSEVVTGFQRQEIFGTCMNTKGFVWGHQKPASNLQ